MTENGTHENLLSHLAESFLVRHNRRPTMADIEDDATWRRLYFAKKESERAAAELQRTPGGCSFYIVRRRRFCTHAAADGLGGLCSEHAAAAGSLPADLPARLPEATTGKKRNLGRRMKRMSNPLAVRACAELPDWATAFGNPRLPTVLDIGCAKGRFLSALAQSAEAASALGPFNCLGLELFAPLVQAANASARAAGLRNLHYVAANVNASLPMLLRIPRLEHVCIQFPDPWQEDELKKRVVTPPLVRALACVMRPGGQVFLVSDRWPLAIGMRTTFLAERSGGCGGGGGGGEGAPLFQLHPLHGGAEAADEGWCSPATAAGCGRPSMRKEGAPAAMLAADADASQPADEPAPPGGWLRMRPYFVPTERDKVCEKLWRPV